MRKFIIIFAPFPSKTLITLPLLHPLQKPGFSAVVSENTAFLEKNTYICSLINKNIRDLIFDKNDRIYFWRKVAPFSIKHDRTSRKKMVFRRFLIKYCYFSGDRRFDERSERHQAQYTLVDKIANLCLQAKFCDCLQTSCRWGPVRKSSISCWICSATVHKQNRRFVYRQSPILSTGVY